MRITDAMLRNTFLRDLFYNSQRTARVQDQMASGRVVNQPSQDALVADQVIGLETQISRAAQYLRNGSAGSSFLSLADSALGNVNSLAVSARTLAVQMANDTVNATMRSGAATETQQLLEQAVEIANRRFRGRFIFGGLETTREPFEITADGVLYHGDLGHTSVPMSDNAANQINVNGADAFGAFDARMAGTVDLDPALDLAPDGTRLTDLNRGAGVSPGAISMTYGAVPRTVTVDLSGAESLEDVKALIESATTKAGLLVTVGVDGTGHALTFSTPVTVRELNGNTTARDLGILGPAVSTGLDIDPVVTPLTKISSLLHGGLLPPAGFTVTNGSGSVTITPADLAGTVQDLLTKLNNSAANVCAEISADGKHLNVYSRLNGPSMKITGATATGLGIATAPAGVRADNLFTALIDLRDALAANDRDATAVTIGTLDSSIDQLLRARAEVGARVQRFEATNQRQTDDSTNLTKLLSEINDVDYAKAATDFQQLQNVLQASLRMAAQALPMSLADFL